MDCTPPPSTRGTADSHSRSCYAKSRLHWLRDSCPSTYLASMCSWDIAEVRNTPRRPRGQVARPPRVRRSTHRRNGSGMYCGSPSAIRWPTPRLLWRREAGQWYGMYVVVVVVCMSAVCWMWCSRLIVVQREVPACIHMYTYININTYTRVYIYIYIFIYR